MKSDTLSDLHPRAERAGPIASDSLAAESSRQGGGFSENRGAEPLGVKGSSSNFANTDTSGARTLPPARDAAERDVNAVENDVSDDLKGPGGRKYPEGLEEQADVSRVHGSEKNYSGGSTEAKQEEPRSVEAVSQSTDAGSNPPEKQARKEETGQVSNSDTPDRETRETETSLSQDPAPSYVAHVASSTSGGKPKGRNLTEGGFDDDPANNASFNPDIDREDDPAREAIKHFQGVTQSAGGDVGPAQQTQGGEGQYDVLGTDEKL